MAKTVVLDWNDFMHGKVTNKNESVGILLKTSAGFFLLMVPKVAYAAGTDSWVKIFTTVMGIVDWVVVGVFIFSGLKWMFGDRTKSIESLIGGCIGYLIARHAMDIRDWLKGI